MKTSKLLKIAGGIVVALLVLAIAGKKLGWFGAKDGIAVSTAKVETRHITEIITANGKIEPETEVKISPDVSGEIVDLQVEEGQAVEAGQLLLKIKPDIYVSSLERATAALNSAKSNYANSQARLAQVEAQFTQSKLAFERSKKLWEQKTISQADFENAQAAFESAKAEVEAGKQSIRAAEFQIKSAEASVREAQENLGKTSMFAPMSGTISRLNVEKGERVVGTMQMAGTELLRIANLRRMELKVEVNENDILKVSRGDTAVIEIDAYIDRKFKGVVTEIANSANATLSSSDQVTNFEVKILLLESSYADLLGNGRSFPFRPGMSATADIQTESRYNVLSVPIQAVTARPDTAQHHAAVAKEPTDGDSKTEVSVNAAKEELKEAVFVVSEGKAAIRFVKTGIQDNDYIEILSGINADDEVITGPYRAVSKSLKPGDVVRVVPESELFKK